MSVWLFDFDLCRENEGSLTKAKLAVCAGSVRQYKLGLSGS